MGNVYILKNTVNEQVYIGSTTRDLSPRLIEHKCRANRNCKRKVYEAMRTIGIDNFYIELLEGNIPNDDLVYKENDYINSFKDKNNLLNTFRGYTYDKIEDIKQRYLAGQTILEISKYYKACKKTISKILHEYDVDIRDWNGEQRATITDEELLDLYINKNMTALEIGNMYNVSDTAILNRLKKINVQRRKAVSRKYL